MIDGPFSETKELVAGFWLWQVKSKEEATEARLSVRAGFVAVAVPVTRAARLRPD